MSFNMPIVFSVNSCIFLQLLYQIQKLQENLKRSSHLITCSEQSHHKLNCIMRLHDVL